MSREWKVGDRINYDPVRMPHEVPGHPPVLIGRPWKGTVTAVEEVTQDKIDHDTGEVVKTVIKALGIRLSVKLDGGGSTGICDNFIDNKKLVENPFIAKMETEKSGTDSEE